MRARAFGLLLLLLAGAAPLGTFAYLSIDRSAATALAEVQRSNERLARAIAAQISAYAAAQSELTRVIGAAALRDAPEGGANAVLEHYAIEYDYFHDLSVYRVDGTLVAGPGLARELSPLVARALAGESAHGPLQSPGDDAEVFGHTQAIAEPVVVAGRLIGAITAHVDLIHTWQPIDAERIGDNGYARLVARDGAMLAHGDPEERRFVFTSTGREANRVILQAARAGRTARNRGGTEVIASAADVPGRDWVVIVERPVSEAFAAAATMKRNLLWLGLAALAFVILVGVLAGRPLVRSLERLREYTKILGRGDLEARIDTKAPVVEVQELAAALNDMAGSIQQLHDEAKARERLSTFARVAAGLAHDLQKPIELLRVACAGIVDGADDEQARELFDFVTENELPRLKRYVEDLRRLAHEGDVPLEPTEICPLELAETIVERLKNTPKWRGLAFEAAGSARVIWADRSLLQRAIYNLASNACDACVSRGPSGRVKIEVADATDGASVEFRVRDNGSGVEPDALARVLDGDFHSTKRDNGVGLGFGVARHVAQAHGGRIEAESVVGAGSTFTVRLPLEPNGALEAGGADAEIGGDRVVGPSSHATH